MPKSSVNFLKETIIKLAVYNRTPGDILWCGSPRLNYWITWDQFAKAADFEYSMGYGAGPTIALDLVVVGKDFWLERQEYDGKEWWSFRRFPEQPPIHRYDPPVLLRAEADAIIFGEANKEDAHEETH
jgi:hypothetical protein